MKSDREFLDGIYKKAQELNESEKTREKSRYHFGYKTLRQCVVTGIAIVFIVSGIVAYDSGILPFQDKNSNISVDENNQTPNLVSENMVRGVIPNSLENTTLPQEIEEDMKNETVIRGKVTTLLESEDQREMIVEIYKVYSGDAKIGQEIKVKFQNNSLSDYSYNLLTGDDDILLYLKVDENNQYSLAHEIYGVFSYYEQTDGYDVFIGEDLVTLNTNIFADNND